MAANDIKIVSSAGVEQLPAKQFQVTAGATAIYAGEPVILTTIGSNQYASVLTDGMPLIGTDYVAGIAKSNSTQTASAAGTVEVYVPVPGTVYRAKAKDSTAVNTQAKIDALNHKRVVLDLTSSSYTVDTAASDAAGNGVMIVGGSLAEASVDFIFSARTTYLGF